MYSPFKLTVNFYNMGIAIGKCCRKQPPPEVKQLLHEQEVTEIQTANAKPQDNNILNQLCKAESFVLRAFIDNSEIIKLCDMFFNERQLYQAQAQLIKSCNFSQIFDSHIFGMSLPKENSSEVINVVLNEYKTRYTAEYMVYIMLNRNDFMNEHLDENEVLQYEAYEDTVYLLKKLRSKRVLLVQPREMVTICVVKRLASGKFIDLEQSVDLNSLSQTKKISEIYAKIQNLTQTVFIAGGYYEDKEGHCQCLRYARNDPKSSIGMKLAKLFLGKSFEKNLQAIQQACGEAFEQEEWKRGPLKYWFNKEGSKEELLPSFFGVKERAIIAPK